MTQFQAGDRVIYSVVQGVETKELPATVKSVGPKRVTIITDDHPFMRIVMPNKLRLMETTA